MKNAWKLLFVIAVLLSGYLLQRNRVVQQDLLLLNIEALSKNETGNVECYGLGTVDCPGSHIKVAWALL